MRMIKNSGWALFAAFLLWAWWTDDTTGVLLANEIPEKVRTEVQRLGLEDGEEVLTFYEFSLGTFSEYAALTDRRLLYLNDGHTTSLPYGEISSVEMTEAFIGADIVVVAKDGRVVRLLMANDPELFLRALNEQKSKSVASAEPELQNPAETGPAPNLQGY